MCVCRGGGWGGEVGAVAGGWRGVGRRGGQLVEGWFCVPSEKGSALKRKEFAPNGSKFFPFRVDLFNILCFAHEIRHFSSRLDC